MAWNDISEVAPGGAVATSWGNSVRENLLYLYSPPRARVRITSSFSVQNNAIAAVLFDAVRWNEGNVRRSATDKLYAPVDGYYKGGVTCSWAPSSGSAIEVYIMANLNDDVNSLDVIAKNNEPDPGGGFVDIAFGFEWSFTADEFARVLVKQNSGAALNLTACEFWMSRDGH